MKIIIGTRASNLARKQAGIIKNLLEKSYSSVNVEIKTYTTKGDQRLDINWKNSPESLKGLFTSELEIALLNNEIDIAVHSLKDMPADIHHDLCVGGYFDYQDERDVLLSIKYDDLRSLPANAVVGTSSSRREMQLKSLRDDLDIRVIRGNIETRIKKMENNEYDAIILAAAGLIRTNNLKYAKYYFNDDEMISASGQGILCLETRKHDIELNNLIKAIEEADTTIKAEVERTFSKIFDGGCTTPMGCNAKIIDERITFKGMYYHNGTRYGGYVEGYLFEKEAIAYRLVNQIKNQYCKDKGKVSLVGAGPGNVELLTIKAYNAIKEADCILYDRLIGNEILEIANENAHLEYVGKENYERGLSQALINEQLVAASFKYKKIVRLKSGDPFIYGRGYEELQALALYNIECDIIPGLSSFSAASTYGNIPLTDRHTSSSIHIFSGHGKNNSENLDYEKIAKLKGTLVFYMAIKNIKNIVSKLIEYGLNSSQKIAFIENASTIDQRVITSTLLEVSTTDLSDKVKSPAIIIIGDVVGLRTKNQWLDRKQNVTLLSTRESKYYPSFEKHARDYNFSSLSAPQIKIVEIPKNNNIDFDEYDIILFNSANGVRYFNRNYDRNILKDKIIGSVGLKTSEEINKMNYDVTIMPKVFNMEELLTNTINLYPNKNVLVVASLQTQLDIEVWKRRVANKISLLITYDTHKVDNDYQTLKEQINNSNVICFFSSSGVKSFLSNIHYELELLDAKKIASIGPYTSKTLKEYNVNVDIEAKTATQEGLIDEIKEFYNV
ncbi:uroporphyrinogen III methyltransferase/synthase [Bacilli bacterium PM5-3]|nr:uroporphyrinogen III methyltransferase/synthase [Bacilli bacterium PM5-3]